LGLTLLGQIPLIQSICQGSDEGVPPALSVDTITGKAFEELSLKVSEQVKIRNDGFTPTQKVKVTRK
jgi:ATP-binding protein involved in chromosome partitioning